MRPRFRAIGIGAAVGLLMSGLSGVPVAAQDLRVVVDEVGSVTSGQSFDVVAHLVGASATDVAAGIDWLISGPRIQMNGWDVSSDGADYSQRGPTRYQGATAIFTVYAEINGTYVFDVSAATDSSQRRAVATVTTQVTVATPDAITVPVPPSSVRLETQGLSEAVPATVAFFQVRLVAQSTDWPNASYMTLYQGPTQERDYTVERTLLGTFLYEGQPSPWYDIAMDWRFSNYPISVSISAPIADREVMIFYHRNVAPPLINFERSAVLEVFPAAAVARCSRTSTRLTCDVGAINAGLDGRATVSPNAITVRAEIAGTASSTGKERWIRLGEYSPPLNISALRFSQPIPKGLRKVNKLQVRMTVLGNPQGQVIVTPQLKRRLDTVSFSRSPEGA